MDMTLVTGTVGALRVAVDIGKAAIGIRDANKLAEVVVSMNEQLLNAQQSLFAHNAELLDLQQQYFQTTQELREAKEALADRRRYALFDIGDRQFVLRADARPASSGPGEPVAAEPEHYVCQPCFEGSSKTKVVLQHFGKAAGRRAGWLCPACKTIVSYGDHGPRANRRPSSNWLANY